MDRPTIAIIGAGSSGIAAATKLYENGFHNLIILEAEDRIGGRINTIPFGDNVIDIGAQWCHGEVDNVVYEMVQPLGLLASTRLTIEDGLEYRRVNGDVVNRDQTRKLDELAFRISDDTDELVQFNGSVGDYMLEKFNHEISHNEKYSDIDSELANDYIRTFQHQVNVLNASDNWFDLSSNMEHDDPQGDQMLNWKDKGFKTILDVMLKKIPNPDLALPIEEKIHFNKRVIRIEWNKNEKADVTIFCEDGSSYIASHVIITVSLGVLKENYAEMFLPALPPAKQKAIQTLSFGTVAKIFLEFENAAWPESWLGFVILWKANELVEIKNQHGDWIGDVMGFFRNDSQPKILMAWISGSKAKDMEQISDERLRIGIQALLDKFLPDFHVGQPKIIKQTKWFSNKNFRGSYSYRSLVAEEQGVFPKDLADPVDTADGHFTLQFAGEATHTKYYATVNGAIETGWREAQRIIDHYKK